MDHIPNNDELTRKGILIVSLDFELYWGVRDIYSLDQTRAKLLAARSAIPALLDLFVEYGIHATWATVGMLFAETRDELVSTVPSIKPQYDQPELSPYQELERVGSHEGNDPYHYAGSLIRLIRSTPHQEIGTHTFSHYYCLEDGQQLDAFQADLITALDAAHRLDLKIESIVFPRNQVNSDYLQVCAELGINTYRGNNAGWIYAPRQRNRESQIRRAIRLLDCYFKLSGHNTYNAAQIGPGLGVPMNLPSSRYLRMYTKPLGALEPLRLARIRGEMMHAASHRRIYHLWLHPEDLGSHFDENLSFLRKILDSFAAARDRNEMESLNMRETFQKFYVSTAALANSPAGEVYAGAVHG
jgi:hypothetical protein